MREEQDGNGLGSACGPEERVKKERRNLEVICPGKKIEKKKEKKKKEKEENKI